MTSRLPRSLGFSLLALTALGVAGVAAADARPHGPGRLEALFDEFDADKNGQLSKDELRKGLARKHEERFKRKDKNGDGALTEDEVHARKWAHLAAADANKDKRITRAEIEEAMKRGTLKPWGRFGHGKRGRGGWGGEGPDGGGGPGRPQQ